MSQFQSLSEQVYELYSSLFDADPATLNYVNLYPTSSPPFAALISHDYSIHVQ